MAFGLCNAPATFQRLMVAVLAGLKWKTLLVFMDDIGVFSKDFDTHLQDLKDVFIRLEETNLKLKPSKCHIFQKKLKFLGHVNFYACLIHRSRMSSRRNLYEF